MSWEEMKAFFSSLTLSKILPVLLVFLVCVIVTRILLRIILRMLERSKLNRTMFSFLKTTLRIVLYSLVVLITAGSLGIDVSSLIAVLSVISLAVSLAVQGTLENVVGGLSLLTTHPFHVGDFVQIGSDSGTVEEIRMSYTKIETIDGKHVYIPNRDASTARICNYSDNGKRRIDITISASYKDDCAKVKEALLAASEHPNRLEDEPIEAYVNDYLGSGVEYILRFWVNSEVYVTTRFEVLETIKAEFDDRGLTIPFPQMEIREIK